MKVGGKIPWMLHLSAEGHRSLIWWENSLWKTFWATIWRTDYSIWFICWVSPYNCEGPVKNALNLERKSYLDCSSDTHCTRVEFGRVTNWSQTLRSWRRWTHRKSHSKRLNAKEVIFPKEKGEFISPIADGRTKFLGGDQDLRTSTSIWQRQGEGHLDSLGESGGFFHHLTTRFRMPVKRQMTSGPCQETLFSAITLNQESNFTRRE